MYSGEVGITSTVNSTTSALDSTATYTGTGELNSYNQVMVQVATDLEGVLYCEFSPDNTNWDTSLSFNYNPNRINPPHVFVKGNRYFRVRFVNSETSAQSYLRLYTYYGSFKDLTAPINGTLSETYDAIVVRPTEYRYEVAEGKRQGRSTINKWGYNTDVDTGGEEIIAAFGGTFNIMTTADTLNVVSTSAFDASAGIGARTIQIIGIDENHLYQTETITMTGTTPATTVNQWLGVNRVIVLSSGSTNANAGTITLSDTSATFGTQAQIPSGDSVTQQAIYHTQINHNLLTDWMLINVNKVSGGSTPTVTIRGWSYSRVTETDYEIFRIDVDTSIENTIELRPSQPFPIGGREVLYFTAETSLNNTIVSLRFSGIEQRVN